MRTGPPSIRGLWGLFWRSAILLPVAVALTMLYFAFWTAVAILPIAAIYLCCLTDWTLGIALLLAWIPLLFLTRWKKLHVSSKDTLNEFENV